MKLSSTKKLIVTMLALMSWQAWPACSPYMGLVTINEASKVNQNPSNNNGGDNANDFIEIKLLDNSISSSVYNNWNLQLCENSGTGCNTISVSAFDASGSPWLVISGLTTVGRHLNFSVGSDILLTDINGDEIDYLSTGGYTANQPACAFTFDTDAVTASSTRRVKRVPDGTGDWDAPTGNSEPDSENTTNDDGVPAGAPSLSIDDVVVNAGGIATFTLTLDSTFGSDVNVDYQTQNNTAIGGSDYVTAAGIATITAGQTSTTVDVTTSVNGSGFFYLALSNADNSLIVDQLGQGIIIPPPLTEWRFDETTWNGTSDEVVDESANGLHGTAQNGGATANTNEAITGDPGTCGYGDFDGNNDHIEVGDDNLLDLTTDLTISAWVYPTANGIDQTILSKGGSFTISYRLRINSNNQLDFTWCTARFLGLCSASTSFNSTGTIGINQWVHVAVSFSNGSQTLYINGVADGTGAATSSISTSGTSLTIGAALGIFSTDDEFQGQIDEVRLYDLGLDGTLINQIMNDTHPCAAASLDHYRISFDGGASVSDSTGITCAPISITIVAHGAGHLEPVTPGTGTAINLSTSTGNGFWSFPTTGTVVDGGNGNAVYTFAGNDAVTLQFNHTVPAVNPSPVNININAGTGNPNEDGAEDPDVQFFDTGFRFVDAGDVATIANQIAAQQSTTYSLQAIRTDTQTGSCVGVFANGTQVDVELAAECNNPNTCAALQTSLTNNSMTQSVSTTDDNGGVGATSYTTFANLLFGADSKADFTFNYPDVGSISLHARYQIENDDGSASGNFMLGSSNSFVVSPADFVITVIESGVTSNPATTNSGIGFLAAGSTFRAVVEARNALGNVTPNYGNESVAEGIAFNFSSLVFPVGGSDGLLSNVTNFSNTGTAGEFENTNLAWNEVGTFTAFASVGDGDYLGAGDMSGTVSGNIGRFFPAQFELTASAVSNSCSTFSYLSENSIAASYQIEARNSGGITVLNYDNTDLVYPGATLSVHGEDNNDGNDLSARLAVVASAWDDGVMVVIDSAASMARAQDVSFNTVTDGPFANLVLGLQIGDIDNVNFSNLDFKPSDNNDCVADGDCDSKVLSGTLSAVFGRLRLTDVHGPESAAIPMVWQTEYWNGSQFVVNTADQCTLLALSDVSFVGASTAINAASDTIAVDIGGVTSVFDFSDPVGASDCMDLTNIGICDGLAGNFYGAPGAIVAYPIDIDLTAYPYLQGDWNQDGNYNDAVHPRIYVRFQHYRGNDRVIYWRERLQ